MRVDRHLERALAVAATSTQPHRHGAVIAHGSRVLSVGVNTRRNRPEICSDPQNEAAFHAEVAALRSLNTTVPHSRLTLYSARVDKEGNKKLAKPCARCMAVLDYVGLHNIYWTEETI